MAEPAAPHGLTASTVQTNASSAPAGAAPPAAISVATKVEQTHEDNPEETGNDAHTEKPGSDPEPPGKKGADFWIIIAVMCAVNFAAGLDATIVTTALPKIAQSIGGQSQYVWIADAFVITSTVFQPLFGQLSNIFGRRTPILVSVALFVLGAGIAGGANNIAMLIAGRAVQGIGSAGLYVLSEIIVCDIAPLRERGKYVGIVLSTTAVGTVLGPIIGGALAEANWRWCFYINLPLGGPCFVLMALFLRLKHTRSRTWLEAVARVDYIGSFIFIPSIIALVLGLIMGGSVFPWSSWRVILPIVLGAVGWMTFHAYEATPWCKEPGLPPYLFANRTTVIAYVLTFIVGMMLGWSCFFIAFYFQAVRGASPLLSGVDSLPLFVFLIPSTGIAGALLSKLGQYKPLHMAGFGLITLGVGLFSITDANTNPAAWVFFQIFISCGIGILLTSLLPAVLAGLAEADVATATAAFSFLRSLGYIWGIAIPSIVFNNQFDASSYLIHDADLRRLLSNGNAFAFVQSGMLQTLPTQTMREAIQVYVIALSQVWHVGVAFPLLGFLLVFAEKHIPLRTSLDTEYGIDKSKKSPSGDLEMENATANELADQSSK